MSRRRKSRSLSALAIVALSHLLGLMFSIVGISLYEKDNPHIRQVDVDTAYKKGYSDGYAAGYDMAMRIVETRSTATPSPTSANSLKAWLSSTRSPTSTPVPLYRGEYPYVGNRHSRIFHYPNCPYVDAIEDEYKVAIDSRAEAIEDDYIPCLICNP